MSDVCEGYEVDGYFVQSNGIIRNKKGLLLCRIEDIEQLQAKIKEVEAKNILHLKLYAVADEMMAQLGCDGVITTDHWLTDAVMNALFDIDGGTNYDTEGHCGLKRKL